MGSLFALDLIKNSINKKIKIPDVLVMVHPYTSIITEDQLKLKEFFHDDDNDYSFSLENLKNEKINIKFNDIISENIIDIENDKLNFLLTDSKYLKFFPRVLLITPENEPFKRNCQRLYDFFMYLIIY